MCLKMLYQIIVLFLKIETKCGRDGDKIEIKKRKMKLKKHFSVRLFSPPPYTTYAPFSSFVIPFCSSHFCQNNFTVILCICEFFFRCRTDEVNIYICVCFFCVCSYSILFNVETKSKHVTAIWAVGVYAALCLSHLVPFCLQFWKETISDFFSYSTNLTMKWRVLCALNCEPCLFNWFVCNVCS